MNTDLLSIKSFKENHITDIIEFEHKEGYTLFKKDSTKTKIIHETNILYDVNLLDFDDEIIEIEDLGYNEVMDIEVDGDNLFYANNILTKNSIGLTAVVDSMLGIIFPEELREKNIQIWKVLKNRYSGVVNQKIPLSVNFARAKLTGIDNNQSEDLGHICSVDNSGEFLKEKKRKNERVKVEVKLDEEDKELLTLLGDM